MIISSISDGLGNQMFQYALGRNLGIKKKTEFKLDISWYKNVNSEYTPREFKLNKLNIRADIASESEINILCNPNYPFLLNSIYWRLQNSKPYYKKNIVKEQFFNFDANIFLAKKNTYLKGFWQSYKYFEEIQHFLVNELKPLHISASNAITEKTILQDNKSVSLHFRRSDYLKNNGTHYALNEDYYRTALSLIKQTIPAASFYIFSDEPQWVINNFKIDGKHTVINANAGEPEMDMYLMSCCKHNIIANSSFSWWAAWLNQNKNKIVIAPKKWFNNITLNTNDLIPPSWIQL